VGFERRAVRQVEALAAEPTEQQQRAEKASELGATVAFDSSGKTTAARMKETMSV
jgi:hypothetical protein